MNAMCNGLVREPSYGPRPCQRHATVEREGRGYCHLHDPEVVKSRQANRDARAALSAAPVAAQQPAVVGDGVPEILRSLIDHVQDMHTAKVDVDRLLTLIADVIRAWRALTPAATPVPVAAQAVCTECGGRGELHCGQSGWVPCGHCPDPPAQQGPVVDDDRKAATEFRLACYALKDLVEGPGCLRWQDSHGLRLKDTNEWVVFYNCVTDMQNKRAELAHPPQDGRKGEEG